MRRFEYKQIITRGQVALSEDALSRLGKDGWELVSIVHHPNAGQFLYVFKKEEE